MNSSPSIREPESAFLAALNHADDNLILAQRLSGWVASAPDLETDIALANIALDHLGVARALLAHAAEFEGLGRTEDDLAMLRSEREFTNLLLCELPTGTSPTRSRASSSSMPINSVCGIFSRPIPIPPGRVGREGDHGSSLPLPFLFVVGRPSGRRHR